MTSLTKRHFIAIAAILKRAKPGPDGMGKWNVLVLEFADYCASQNELFDRDRFYEAAGFEEVLR